MTLNEYGISIRENLALERTKLANARTFLAYVRTALALFASGIGMQELLKGSDFLYLGILLFIAAPIIFVIGILYTLRTNRNIINSMKEKQI